MHAPMSELVVVAGSVNEQTTVPIGQFPIAYQPVRYLRSAILSRVGGAGFVIAAQLRTLGSEVRLATFLGDDPAGRVAQRELSRRELLGPGILPSTATPQSVILRDQHGRRQIHADVKDLPELRYPQEAFLPLLTNARFAAITTVGFARPLLAVARAQGVPIATDLHVVSDMDDDHNQPWLAVAEIVFCSHEQLPLSPIAWTEQLLKRYPARIAVVGCGAAGCVLAVRGDQPRWVTAVAPRGVVDTTGAGDTLFASFLHYLARSGDPYGAIDRAVVAAGLRVGDEQGAPINDEEVAAFLR